MNAPRSPTPQSPYAPALHQNPLRAALQLWSWLLFRPSAWRQQIHQVAPDLAPDFTLLHLTRAHWRHPRLRRLLTIIYLLWPMMVACLVAVILWALGKGGSICLMGAGIGFTLGLASGLATGTLFSVAAGLSGIIFGGLALGLVASMAGVPLSLAPTETTAMLSLNYRLGQPRLPADPHYASSQVSPGTAMPQAQDAVVPASVAVLQFLAEATMAAEVSPLSAEANSAKIALPATSMATFVITTSTAVTLASPAMGITEDRASSPLATPVPVVMSAVNESTGADTAASVIMDSAANRPPAASIFISPLPALTPATAADDQQGLQPSSQALPAVSAYAAHDAMVDLLTPLPEDDVILTAQPAFRTSIRLSTGALFASALGLTVMGMIIGLAVLVAADAETATRRAATAAWRRKLGEIAVGILVSTVFVLLALVTAPLLKQLQGNHLWLLVSIQGLLLTWIVNSETLLRHSPPTLLAGAILILTSSLLVVLPYRIGTRLAGAWAGGVAGALGGGGALVALCLVITEQPLWPLLPLSLLCLAGGLTLPLWWPLLHYPLVATWSALLLRLEQRRGGQTGLLLSYHPAFWDELQSLPLPGLDEHLVLAVERTGAQAQPALAFLSTGHQRWAAQAAQIELDARRLATCQHIAHIPVVCRQVVAGELSNAASAVLRAFHRIGIDIEAALTQESLYHQRLALAAIEERLDGLLRELTRSNERYATRFQPIAASWWQLVHVEVTALTTTAELRQEIESPYIIGIPLTAQQEIFVGRADIGERIEQLLRDQHHPPLLLYGQRRMGKTSLLNNLGRLLPSTIVPLFVDLQGPVALAGDHAGFLYNLARAMSDSARRQRDLSLPPLPRDELTNDPFSRFDEWLDAVEQSLGNCTALLALDEFEVLDSAFAAGRLQAEAVLGSLRHWVQHRPRFKILLTGSHVVEELRNWANYLINVQVVHIGYLGEAEARRLVERPVKDFSLRYEPAATQRVWELTHGHPALTQLLCYELVALKNQQVSTSRRLATIADVETAAGEALGRGALFFHEIETGQLTTEACQLLRWLARQGEGVVVSVDRVQAAWPDGVGPALKLLLRRELIGYYKGGYHFQVELIRRWFAQEQR